MKIIKLRNPSNNNDSDNLGESAIQYLQEVGVKTLVYWYLESQYDTDEGFALVQVGDLWQCNDLGFCPCCMTGPTDDLETKINERDFKSLDQLQQELKTEGSETSHSNEIFEAARRF